MSWGVLFLLTAHVLGPHAICAQDSQIAPTLEELVSSVPSSVPASTGKSNDPAGKSVVVNWKLTCQQLCSEGYGGPACGLACLQRVAVNESDNIKLNDETQQAVCATLCDNGLGSKRCICKAVSPPNIAYDPNGVCSVFCVAANIQLNGCSHCDGGQFSDTDITSGTPVTTPNWDELCTVWCKMGEGGTLCNCDLPPFI